MTARPRKHLSNVTGDSPPEPHVTVIDAARRLGISKTRYYAGLRRGELPGRFVGDTVLILKRWLDRFIETGQWGDEEKAQGESAPVNPFLVRKAS